MEASKKIPIKTIKEYMRANFSAQEVTGIKKTLGIRNLQKLSPEQKQQLTAWYQNQTIKKDQPRRISKSRKDSETEDEEVYMPNLEQAINEQISESSSEVLKSEVFKTEGKIKTVKQLSNVIQKSQSLSKSDQQTIINAIQADILEEQQLSLAQSHPSSIARIRQMQGLPSNSSQLSSSSSSQLSSQRQSQSSNYIPNNQSLGSYLGNNSVVFVDHQWFKINKRREKIYDLIKSHEKIHQESQLERNKLLYKELTRNGNMGGAQLAVIENNHGIEEYRKKYASIDEMLNNTIMNQFSFDLQTKNHMTLTQADLFKSIVSSGQSVLIPNLQFIQDKYKNSAKKEDFQEYQQALIKSIGQQVSYIGAQDWSSLKPNQPSQNFAAPALSNGLTKPQFMDVSNVLQQISNMADYISKLTGNLNSVDLRQYQDQNNLFTNIVIQKKEQTSFVPTVGQAFKLRQLAC